MTSLSMVAQFLLAVEPGVERISTRVALGVVEADLTELRWGNELEPVSASV